jgi:hypothetical protein
LPVVGGAGKEPRMSDTQPATPEKPSTEVEGLDQVLAGGLPRNRLYLLEGRLRTAEYHPGAGRTTDW